MEKQEAIAIDNYVRWALYNNNPYYFLNIVRECLLDDTNKEETTMSFDINKPFAVGNSWYGSNKHSNLEDALRDAKEQSASERKDIPVYKAVQIVKFPEIKAEDLKTEKVA